MSDQTPERKSWFETVGKGLIPARNAADGKSWMWNAIFWGQGLEDRTDHSGHITIAKGIRPEFYLLAER